MANKVQFGLNHVYYAVLTEGVGVAPEWGTPKAIAGAVNLTLSHESAVNNFYADNTTYYRTSANNGYTGSIEFAKIPDDMLKDVFGFGYDNTAKVIFEDSTVEPKPFALLFKITGDANEEDYVFYRCYASRPNIESHTTDDSGKNPQTQTLDLTILPVVDTTSGSKLHGKVKARTDASTTSTVKNAWYSEVFTDFV